MFSLLGKVRKLIITFLYVFLGTSIYLLKLRGQSDVENPSSSQNPILGLFFFLSSDRFSLSATHLKRICLLNTSLIRPFHIFRKREHFTLIILLRFANLLVKGIPPEQNEGSIEHQQPLSWLFVCIQLREIEGMMREILYISFFPHLTQSSHLTSAVP